MMIMFGTNDSPVIDDEMPLLCEAYPGERFAPGEVGFVIWQVGGWPSGPSLVSEVPRTNQGIPRGFGWLGTTQDVSQYACGVWRVENESSSGKLWVRKVRETGA